MDILKRKKVIEYLQMLSVITNDVAGSELDELIEALKKELTEFPAVMVSREDFGIEGFEGAENISDEDMELLATEIGQGCVNDSYWEIITKFGEAQQLPKNLNHEDNE